MNKAGIIATALFIGINAYAQKIDVDTLLYNGNADKHINLVILGDGYTENELPKFVVDAANFTAVFLNETPFSNYRNYFNVFIIKVPSKESGASHPGTATDMEDTTQQPVIKVDNYFGSTFDGSGIHRLLVPTKTTVISSVLASNIPNYDQVLMLVNSPYYGGSGGLISVGSNSSPAQLAIHEIGHTFAKLGDEYWPGSGTEAANMTKESNTSLVRWKNWIGINSIGIYQHCCGGDSQYWYKPAPKCLMQFNSPDYHFCSVCIQALIESIHYITTPIESYDPYKITTPTYPVKFKLNLITPEPNTLKISWLLNGTILRQNVDSVLINGGSLFSGTNTLKVIIEDTTQLLRVDNHTKIHLSLVSWSLNSSLIDINNNNSFSSEILIDLFPNPTSDYLNIRFSEAKGYIGYIKVEIYDTWGQKLLSQEDVNPINLQNLSQGIYIVKIYIDNDLVTTRKIIKE